VEEPIKNYEKCNGRQWQEFTERQWNQMARAKYWDAMYDENGVSIFDEEPKEANIEELEYEEDCDFGYYNPYDDWENEPYDDENPITHYELSRLPADMRAAFDPRYKMCLDDFKSCMYDNY
jgi:hypothetical protein